jgi:hypothetical protein
MTVQMRGTLDAADHVGVWENEGGYGTRTTMVNAPPTNEHTCMACGHLGASHDAIARRYCNATVAHALTRKCICSAQLT